MYNVLQKLRAEEPLSAKDKAIHENGLVSVLKKIHDDLDAAVFDAYGWPRDLSDEQILERLVALNAKRAEEEKRGLIRWLRPEYQQKVVKVKGPAVEPTPEPSQQPSPQPSPQPSSPGPFSRGEKGRMASSVRRPLPPGEGWGEGQPATTGPAARARTSTARRR
jgi:hypothetical protein